MKYIFYIILLAILIGLTKGAMHLWRVAEKNKQEMTPYEEMTAKTLDKNKKILVVYYSLSGNTKDIAKRIKSQSGADLYSIELKSPLPTGLMAYYKIWKQYKDKQMPELKGQMPNFAEYDLIILGSPVWMYTVSTPMQSFLQQADFQNKPVAVYSTQGSNPGTFFADIRKQAKHAKIINEIEFNNLPKQYDKALNNKINKWLSQILSKAK